MNTSPDVAQAAAMVGLLKAVEELRLRYAELSHELSMAVAVAVKMNQKIDQQQERIERLERMARAWERLEHEVSQLKGRRGDV
jgi:hypothetical protein